MYQPQQYLGCLVQEQEHHYGLEHLKKQEQEQEG